MDVGAVIVEQLDSDGTLKTFRLQAEYGKPLTVAFASEYDEPRSGPFHFLDRDYERAFDERFAECRSRKVSGDRLRTDLKTTIFSTSWTGIPTKSKRISYYALSLPRFSVPNNVRFFDPRSGRDYKKVVARDDANCRFILYLECRSSYGTFDFGLEVDFETSQEKFASAEYNDETTLPWGQNSEAYERMLTTSNRTIVKNFFMKETVVRNEINVSGTGNIVGEKVTINNSTIKVSFLDSTQNLDLDTLALELSLLRAELRKHSETAEHDIAVAEIGKAELAARNKEKDSVLVHLKSAGKWALGFATSAGAGVAASAIKIALGMNA
jgi:hypothetical protein